MRVIAGSARGKLLKSPHGKNKVRPTADKVKAAFFNMIGEYVVDAKFLDLFAGTGSMGIEALSRGSQKCVFVEKDFLIMQLLLENLRLTAMSGHADTLRCDYALALSILSKKKENFEIIYIDPPYHYEGISKILLFLDKNKLIAPGGIIGVERNKCLGEKSLKSIENLFQQWRRKTYGNTLLLLYINKTSIL